MSTMRTLLATIFLSTAARAEDWLDTYYQYRVPFVTRSENASWQHLPLSEAQVTEAIDDIGKFQFDPSFFAYNYVRLEKLLVPDQP